MGALRLLPPSLLLRGKIDWSPPEVIRVCDVRQSSLYIYVLSSPSEELQRNKIPRLSRPMTTNGVEAPGRLA